MFEKPSIKKVFSDASDLLRQLTLQVTQELENSSGNGTMGGGGSNSSLASAFFMQNTSTNGRLAFAAFQRVVCGRNMSVDQLFSDGGEVRR